MADTLNMHSHAQNFYPLRPTNLMSASATASHPMHWITPSIKAYPNKRLETNIETGQYSALLGAQWQRL